MEEPQATGRAPAHISGTERTRRVVLPRRQGHALRFGVALSLLALSALPIQRESVSSLESRIFDWINELPLLYTSVWAVMQLGNILVVPITAAIALAFRRVRLAFDLAVAGTAAWILAKVVKELIVRGRPGSLLEEVVLRDAPSGGRGFVSGHAAVAVALATVAHPYLGPVARRVTTTLALGVCFARVYVGAHLPLDVVGGAAMGWAIGSLLHLLIGSPTKRPRRVTEPSEVSGAPDRT